MAGPTEEEIEKAKALRQAQSSEEYQEILRTGSPLDKNPVYQQDVFEPESQIPYAPSTWEKPIGSGRYIQPNIPSIASFEQQQRIQEFYEDPQEYYDTHKPSHFMTNAAVEKGATFLARLFDYEDAKDFSMFGIDLGFVESVWDNTIRYLTGYSNVLSVGIGGVVSAMPGGVDTLSPDELTGGMTSEYGAWDSFLRVLGGEMEPGSAPSPGQIALTSIGLEAARIRRGEGRASDVLLANPATAPFIAAALAADKSPIQQPGFDLLDPEQREAAFSHGTERFFSGVTDFGVAFADPLIVVGVGSKFARAGMLGAARGSAKDRQALDQLIDLAIDDLDSRVGRSSQTEADVLVAKASERKAARRAGAPVDETPFEPLPQLQRTVDVDGNVMEETFTSDQFISDFLYRVTAVDDTGEKVMKADEVLQQLEINGLPFKNEVADLLYRSGSHYEAGMILKTLNGNPDSLKNLYRLSPAMADEAYRLRRLQKAQQWPTEATKLKEIGDAVNIELQRVTSDIDDINTKLDVFKTPDGVRFATELDEIEYRRLQESLDRLHRKRSDVEQIRRMVDGQVGDHLNKGDINYDAERATAIVDDLVRKFVKYDEEELGNLLGGGALNRSWFASKNNPYSRMVMASRKRRATARYQYAVEGTSWLPHKRPVQNPKTGEFELVNDGWFSKSMFEGTTRIQRNLRVWRWFGEETPSGYIGLKGMASVGSEREFNAALNLDIYKTKEGAAKRAAYYSRFANALNDETVDAYEVLKQIEDDVLEDIARAYGINPTAANGRDALKVLADGMTKSRQVRSDQLSTLRDRSYFVDEDGSVHKSPFLESMLAEGTYMLPLHELENIAKRYIRRGGADAFRNALATAGSYGAQFDNLFQSLWRPATLLRLSYTQRNLFEGLLRAAAHEVSLRPFTWPVTATALGVRNAIVKKSADRGVAKAAKRIKQIDFNDISAAQTARLEHANAVEMMNRLESATPLGLKDDKAKLYRFTRLDGTTVDLTPDQYAKEIESLSKTIADMERRMKPFLDRYEASIQGTRFARWRQKQIDDLQQTIATSKASTDVLDDAFEDMRLSKPATEVGDLIEIDAEQYRRFSDIREQLSIVNSQAARQLSDLMYDPQAGMAMFRDQAGRARRIGSGTSIGPDGGYWGDAITGPLSTITRRNYSADNTVKQKLQATADAYGSLFTEVTAIKGAVSFNPKKPSDWSRALAEFIETFSSSWVVQQLVLNKGDVQATVNAMQRTAEGRRWTKRIAYLFSKKMSDPADTTDKIADRLTAFTDQSEVSIDSLTTLDVDAAAQYLGEVWQRIQFASQRTSRVEGSFDVFYNILERRVREKNGLADAAPRTEQVAVTQEDIEGIVASLPDEITSKFTPLSGTELLEFAGQSAIKAYGKIITKLFRALSTIPEDAVVRGPFYNSRFVKMRNLLIKDYLESTNQANVLNPGPLRLPDGVILPDGISHGQIAIPAKEINRIYTLAHRAALRDTKEWLYTIDRRTNLGKYGEYVFPFISASQNALTVTGKLLWKEPWLTPFIATLWQSPQRLGFEDEDGNLFMPMPFEGAVKWLADHPEIPVLGGAVDSNDKIVIPKNGLNVMLPDTGFGIVPRMSPAVIVGVSEMMKANIVPQETPEMLVPVMGKKTADEFWQTFKDYMFGTEQGMSAEFASYDKFFPAWMQKVGASRNELSRQYGYKYQLAYHTQMMRHKGGFRDDKPTPEEIGQRATNMLLFDALGNLGVPTPATPYPTLTRPLVKSPIEEVREWYRLLQERDPKNASLYMELLFGPEFLLVANTKITKNIGGAVPSPETVADIGKLDSLIRSITGGVNAIPDTDLDVLGILVNNRSSLVDYETSAYAWQKANKVPGTNREWREIQAPQQSVVEQQRVAGWAFYTSQKSMLDARLASAGYTSYENKGAEGFKAAKKQLVENMMANPDYAGWTSDFQDRGGSRVLSAVKTLEAAVVDDTFRELMVSAGKEKTFSNMVAYVTYRRTLIGMLEKSGNGIDHENNIVLKQAWANIRQDLIDSDVRWADIAIRYLEGDDNPQKLGTAVTTELLELESANG